MTETEQQRDFLANVAVRSAGQLVTLSAERDTWKARCEQTEIKYRLLLDSATNLRETVKDLYNAACFDATTAPPGMAEEFRKAVKEATGKALLETVSVSRIQYTADLEESRPTTALAILKVTAP